MRIRYENVHLTAIAYELPPIVVTSDEIESRLAKTYDALHIPYGQLEALTGIVERRWWPEGHALADGAISAARKALASGGVTAKDIEVVVFAGVNREHFEPATACRVAGELGVHGAAAVYDLSNACLGVMNGMIEVANQIALGQIRAGLVVSSETAREIVEDTIERLNEGPQMEQFVASFATLTGGSGAVAVLLTDGSYNDAPGPRLIGGALQAEPEHHGLCRWGLDQIEPGRFRQYMSTDAASVLRHGVELGKRTWEAFLRDTGWTQNDIDKVICHQVGHANQQAILTSIGIAHEKDFPTYAYLGNIGTVSLPLTAAIAAERGHLRAGDRVAFLGIGSGLNCLMLGVEWQ